MMTPDQMSIGYSKLVVALEQILAIKHKSFGGDWDEIEEAQSIAARALGVQYEVKYDDGHAPIYYQNEGGGGESAWATPCPKNNGRHNYRAATRTCALCDARPINPVPRK